jgi:hypothetical protein
MTTTTKLRTKNLVTKIVALQAQMAPLEAELAEAKAVLLEQMQADGMDKTPSYHGAYGVLVERTNYNVVNNLEVRAWMRERRLTIANFMKFDAPKVREAGKLLNETVPGTSVS